MDFKPMTEEVFNSIEEEEEEGYRYEGDLAPEKTVTAREIVNAIRANGIPQIQDSYFETGNYDPLSKTYAINGGCALGQAALNLGIDVTHLMSTDFGTSIITLNDDRSRPSLEEIAEKMEKQYGDNLDTLTFVVGTADYSNGVPEYIYDRIFSS